MDPVRPRITFRLDYQDVAGTWYQTWATFDDEFESWTDVTSAQAPEGFVPPR